MQKIINSDYLKNNIDFVGCKCVIFIEETSQIIVARRSDTAPKAPNEVDLAGGRRDSEESPYQTCKREVMEEIGLDLEGVQPILAHEGVNSLGIKVWLLFFKVSKELAATTRVVSEMSEVIVEDIEKYLTRTDAWKPFQAHAQYCWDLYNSSK